MEELEQGGVRKDEEGAVAHPISGTISVITGSVDSGPSDGDKLEEAEEAQRIEESLMRVSGRSSSTQGEMSGLGEDLDGCEEVGGEGGSLKGRMSTLVGDNARKQLTVDQVFLIHQAGSESNSLFISDSAIENCNRIFWVRSDKNMASSVWGVGKEAGFSFPGQEEIVLNSISSLSNQGGVTTRKMWKERRKVVNEDS